MAATLVKTAFPQDRTNNNTLSISNQPPSMTDFVLRLSAEGASAGVIAIAVETLAAALSIIDARKEKDRARKASARAGVLGGSKESPGISAECPRTNVGKSADKGGDISSLTSSFFLVDQPLKEESKEVRSEFVALETSDVSRVISDDWPEDYEAKFWAAYPRKIGRKAARGKLRLIRQRKEVTFAALMAAVARIPIGEAKFIPHPTTWLNRGGWEDVHAPQGTQNGPSSGNIIPAADRLVAKLAEFNRLPDASEICGGARPANVRLLSEGRRERS